MVSRCGLGADEETLVTVEMRVRAFERVALRPVVTFAAASGVSFGASFGGGGVPADGAPAATLRCAPYEIPLADLLLPDDATRGDPGRWERLWTLLPASFELAARVDEIEIKFASRESESKVVSARCVATSAEGPWLQLRTYIEKTAPVTGVATAYCDLDGSSCVVAPYPAADAVGKNPPACALSAEADQYFHCAEMLRWAGCDVPKKGPKETWDKISSDVLSPSVVLKPSFCSSLAELKAKIPKPAFVSLSKTSTLILGGDVEVRSLKLDGGLVLCSIAELVLTLFFAELLASIASSLVLGKVFAFSLLLLGASMSDVRPQTASGVKTCDFRCIKVLLSPRSPTATATRRSSPAVPAAAGPPCCSPGRVRSGSGWAGSCTGGSRCSPRRSTRSSPRWTPSWSRQTAARCAR